VNNIKLSIKEWYSNYMVITFNDDNDEPKRMLAQAPFMLAGTLAP
jgi:hypothetical protein